MNNKYLFGFIIAALLSPVSARAAEGLSFPELMQWMGIFAAIGAIVLLFCVEFLFRDRLRRANYYWLLLMGLFILPFVSLGGTTSTVFEETKTVDSCASCHIMEPFVKDMKDPHSATLASKHFRNRWIEKKQCYHCHSGYGVHGTLEAKRDGFRHWAMYVTKTYPDPIRFKGSYPNSNCLNCHATTPKFESVKSHQALKPYLENDEASCITCHGPPHPSPGERESYE